MAAAMLMLALGLPMVDDQFEAEVIRKFVWLEITPRSAQSILASIASANVSIVGVVFSITILTLSIASSQLGPRLLRTFMSDRSTHFALGLYLSTAMYCLVLLTIVKDMEDSSFVPHLSVVFALGAAIFGMGYLIFFINRIAQLIQTPNIVESVANDLDHAVLRLFPEEAGSSAEGRTAEPELPSSDAAGRVKAINEGYLQGLDVDSLLTHATGNDLLLHLLRRPGQFVTRGSVLAEVWPAKAAGEELTAALDAVCAYGNRRTPRQDVECAINELTEVAVRALSPGINDPFTAVNCVDRLAATLARLAQRRIPDHHRYDDMGALRIVAMPETFLSALNAAFDQIRQYGSNSVAILARLLEGLAIVAEAASCQENRDAIQRQGDMILRSARKHLDEENDLADIEERYEKLQTILTRPLQ
jgi:uncharacterized membrane protein